MSTSSSRSSAGQQRDASRQQIEAPLAAANAAEADGPVPVPEDDREELLQKLKQLSCLSATKERSLQTLISLVFPSAFEGGRRVGLKDFEAALQRVGCFASPSDAVSAWLLLSGTQLQPQLLQQKGDRTADQQREAAAANAFIDGATLLRRAKQTDPSFLFFHYAALLKRLQHLQDKKRRLKETSQLLQLQLLQLQKKEALPPQQQQHNPLPQNQQQGEQVQQQLAAAAASPPVSQLWLEEALVPTNAVRMLEQQQIGPLPAWQQDVQDAVRDTPEAAATTDQSKQHHFLVSKKQGHRLLPSDVTDPLQQQRVLALQQLLADLLQRVKDKQKVKELRSAATAQLP
ncbi:hypothetical protein cyc_06663 [Cyclospora cayetanensis]|uniref:Uncharacterized protein n=1 Tax=Cyclospora cayetanensis TaxID=88456 RepID=A0A1D3D0T3_9EIME|nr:hypothetical protein cyc_06663 [Cyclospora cayetanensis]